MRLAAIFLLCLSAVAFGQGTKPPATTLSGLTDVFISAPSNNQSLLYNSSTSKWNNGPPPTPTLATLPDVAISGTTDGQLLRWNAGASKWANYGPLNFTDVIGTVTPAQLNATFGTASSTSFYRGDGAWVAPPIGSIPVTTGVLMGDGGGNAVPATTLQANNLQSFVQAVQSVSGGDAGFKAVNPAVSGGATASLMASGLSVDPGVTLRYYEGAYPMTGLIQNTDASLTSTAGRLLISGKNNIIFGNDGPALATERARIGLGLMVGTTTDKGGGTANVTGGFYMNGNKIGGVATVTATTDQTAIAETVHVVYTVPANSAQIGTVYKIHASGTADNGTTGISFTPKIRWGGTGGVDLLGLSGSTLFTASTTANTNRPYVLDARVTVRTNGASGTAMTEISYVERSTSSSGVETVHVANSATGTIGIDTTVNKDLDLTWILSATTGTPHIRTISGNIEVAQP